MLYEMGNPKDDSHIRKYGKAYGTVLLHKWLPKISKTKQLFVLDSYEDFLKIQDKLPEVFTCRADAKTGEPATLRSRREFCKKRRCTKLYTTCETK